MKILYFDLFSGASAEAIFSALCDIFDAKNLEYDKKSVNVMNIPCSKCTLSDNNVFSESEINFACGISQSLLNGCDKYNNIFSAVKNMVSHVNPDLVMASPIYNGCGFSNGSPVPTPEVLNLFKTLKIPFRTIDENFPLASADGVALIGRLANEYGIIPSEFEIEKIGYGTDGKRVVRVITGFDKQKSMNDLFEISEDFFAADSAYCLK